MKELLVPITLRADDIINHFKPYYANCDIAHDMNHVIHVMHNALKINSKLELGINEELIMIAAIAHDMYSYTDRDLHHLKAYEYINECCDGIFNDLSPYDRIIIARAVLEHRASYTGKYYSKLSEVISAADRGAPRLNDIIKRIHLCSLDLTLTFNTDDMKLTVDSPEEDYLLRTYTHLHKKYGKNGYARYNDIYKEYYKGDLGFMQDMIESITMEEIKKIVSDLKPIK